MLRDNKMAALFFGRQAVSASFFHSAARFRQRRAISTRSNITTSPHSQQRNFPLFRVGVEHLCAFY
jgi:hypothetical protein